MVESARATASDAIEIVAYVDTDDPASYDLCEELFVEFVCGPRILLTDTWNKCFEVCSGDIVGQLNDDLVFRTPGWDGLIEKAFEEVPDQILLVHGDDGGGVYHGTFGPHSFVSRRWVEALGYFIAPFFSSDFGDTWLNDVADLLGRRKYLPFVTEHRHMLYGKAEVDQTTRDRLVNHRMDGVDELYPLLAWKRERDAEKLRKLMFSDLDTRGWAPSREPPPCPHCASHSTVRIDEAYACNACGANRWQPA
jgi:hypothetical protein